MIYLVFIVQNIYFCVLYVFVYIRTYDITLYTYTYLLVPIYLSPFIYRYVDITECIDAGNTNTLDDSQFHLADALPLNGFLPSTHYIQAENTREDVRTWILSVVTDSTIEQSFPKREASKGTLYENIYTYANRKVCIVTGYPVHPADTLEINNSVANRRDWNALVTKTKVCPWTSQPQNTIY